MKISTAVLVLALMAVFGLTGCGDGNNGSSSSSNSACSAPKEKTPAEKRQALVDRMSKAAEANDADALKELFQEDEHDVAEQRIGAEWRQNKTDGNEVSVKSGKIEEADGKFMARWEIETTTKAGEVDSDKPKLNLVEKDGKWYLTFKQ